jgi:hypothetical protein
LSNRKDLKDLFRVGARPSADDFAKLIDSALIMEDEGFAKTLEDGLRVEAIGESNVLMSLQRKDRDNLRWRMEFADKECRDLVFRLDNPTQSAPDAARGGAQRPAAAGPQKPFPFLKAAPPDRTAVAQDSGARLKVDANLSVGGPEPGLGNWLDVSGVVRSAGRIGWDVRVDADGAFHDLTSELRGCTAFEVTAGIGSPGDGRFALLHGVALNTYNPSFWGNLYFFLGQGIRCQHAFYSRRSDRLQLRWAPAQDENLPKNDQGEHPRLTKPEDIHGADARYVLQIRSRTSYAKPGPGQKNGARPLSFMRETHEAAPVPKIRASITQLWFDRHMTGNPSEAKSQT